MKFHKRCIMYTEYTKRKPNTECYICKKPIYKRPRELAKKGNVYCGRKCLSVNQTILKTCPVCQNTFRSGLNKTTCSKACSNKNRTGMKYKIERLNDNALKPRNKKKYLIEVFGKKCMTCEYDNTNVLQVHHIIERKDGGTDELSNLKLLCPNCHYTIHYGDSRLAETTGFEPATPFLKE